MKNTNQTSRTGFKALVGSLLALSWLSIANAADGPDLVAIVDLKFLESTDQPAAVMCFGDKDEDCVLWATHNLCLELKESESESKTCYDAK